MKIISVIIFFLITFLRVQGQILEGIVLEKETALPVSYVSIGIINKEGGTYSDIDGTFRFKPAEHDRNDSLRFSCIGYKSVTLSFRELLEKYFESRVTVLLEKEIFRLNGVDIFPREFRVKEIGNKISNRHICICGFQDREGGILLRNDKTLLLDKLTFKLSSDCSKTPDSVLFRFNIYNLKNDLPAELILTKPIYFLLKDELKNEKITINLEKYNVIITEDFAASLEIIDTFGTGKICFAGWISGNPTFFKYGKQGKWDYPVDNKKQKVKIFMSMILSARIEK